MKNKTADPAIKVPANALPPEQGKNVTTFEYICLSLARIGGMFGTTLTGTLATAFLHELYYGPVGVDSDEIAKILAVQTTLTTVVGIIIGLISGIIVQKWKSRWGRYRQWYIICLVPIFTLTVLYFYVPSGWTVQQMTMFRYGVALCQTIFNAFNNFGQNVAQVISPNPKEKKTVATIWQLSYYIGYGGAYLGTFVYGLFSDDKNAMYMTLAIVAAIVTAFGNLMCGLFCKERIELPKKEKVKISKELFLLFKYRNYRAYQYIQWATVLAALGKFSTLLAAITVGSSKNLLLTIPTAAGTVVGNLFTAKISKKYEPTKLLKFCGPYSMISAGVLFAICFAEAKLGLIFFSGWNSIFFYFFYFLFGVGIGVQELSTSHFNVEYFDYLEWQTGDRMEAIQGIVPGWIQTGLNYLKELAIPFLIAWVGYESSEDKNLVKTMQAKDNYMETCLWLLAFLLFGYALSSLIRSIILKTMYDVEGEKKAQMYAELEVMRANRRAENAALAVGAAGETVAVPGDESETAVLQNDDTDE
ncbi:MAG: MFS transporter [Clostridia bacterium]|nr:MFS transporter [Clostridia bacterium]